MITDRSKRNAPLPSDLERDPYARELSAEEIVLGHHRAFVGGMWDDMGVRQLAFLRDQGLRPEHRLLDIGCGALRAGIHLIDYLDPGHYFGIDRNASLLRAGIEVELQAAAVGPGGAPVDLRGRVDANQFCQTADFDLSAFETILFDFALAHSVFTHTPASALRRCLDRLTDRMRPGGMLFASYFAVGHDQAADRPIARAAGDIETWPDRDPYHHQTSDLIACTAGLPWQGSSVPEWTHPMGQSLLCFTRAG